MNLQHGIAIMNFNGSRVVLEGTNVGHRDTVTCATQYGVDLVVSVHHVPFLGEREALRIEN